MDMGSDVGAVGRVVLRRGTEQGGRGVLPPMLPARLERSEGQEQMDGFGGGQGRREVGRDRRQKQGKQNPNSPPAVSVQSHSSTRQTSIKYSSGLGSSVSSATNGVSSSASSCKCQC